MWEGWQWRWSRDLEAKMIAAAASNGFAKVDAPRICRTFSLYLKPEEDDEE